MKSVIQHPEIKWTHVMSRLPNSPMLIWSHVYKKLNHVKTEELRPLPLSLSSIDILSSIHNTPTLFVMHLQNNNKKNSQSINILQNALQENKLYTKYKVLLKNKINKSVDWLWYNRCNIASICVVTSSPNGQNCKKNRGKKARKLTESVSGNRGER